MPLSNSYEVGCCKAMKIPDPMTQTPNLINHLLDIMRMKDLSASQNNTFDTF